MAKLVMAVGVPHGPMIPWQVANEPGKHAAEALMNDVRQQLEAVEPRRHHRDHVGPLLQLLLQPPVPVLPRHRGRG